MAFIQLKQFRALETVEKKERISLVVKYGMDSHLLFFKDCSFQHIAGHTQVVLFEGRLDFVASWYHQSTRNDRVVVTGLAKDKSFWCSVIDLTENTVESRQVENLQPDSSTKYHLYQPQYDDSSIFLIRVLVNVENGLAGAVYDFWRDLWCEQMIALPSKFLNYHIVNTSICNQSYKEPAQLSCHSFAIIALGQRFDSINYSKLKFSHQDSNGETVLKLKFIITREVKLKRQFIILGAMQCDHSKLFIAGNSIKQQSQERSVAFVTINTVVLENNEPQNVEIYCIDFIGPNNNKYILIRKFIGILQDNLILLVSSKEGKLGLAKLTTSQHSLFFECQELSQYRLSVKKDCYYSSKLQFELFFEKIKNSPSRIAFNLVKIYSKQDHYQHLMRNGLARVSDFFLKEVLAFL